MHCRKHRDTEKVCAKCSAAAGVRMKRLKAGEDPAALPPCEHGTKYLVCLRCRAAMGGKATSRKYHNRLSRWGRKGGRLGGRGNKKKI